MPSAALDLAIHITFAGILHLLVWVVWTVLNLWIWQKTKAQGNLLMMIGSAVLAFGNVMGILGEYMSHWIPLLALITLTAGFFLSVRPMVEAHLAKLKDKIHHATAGNKAGGGGAS